MWCLLRLDLAVIVNQSFCFVPRVQKIFALVEYLRVIFLPTLYLLAALATKAGLTPAEIANAKGLVDPTPPVQPNQFGSEQEK